MEGSPLSPSTFFKFRLTTIMSVAIALVGAGATVVKAMFTVRDDAVRTAYRQQQEILKHYPDRVELMQAIERMNAMQDARYLDIKDRIGTVGNKVDGMIIYLRRKL